jgi:hypothetical protein
MIFVIFRSFFYLMFLVVFFIDAAFLPLNRDLLVPQAVARKEKRLSLFLRFLFFAMALQILLELTLGWVGLIWWPILGFLIALVSMHSSRLALFGLIVFAYLFYFPSSPLTGEEIPYWKNSSKYPSFITFIQKRDGYFTYLFYVYKWDNAAKAYREIASGKSFIHVKPRISPNATANQVELYTRGWLSKITWDET